MKAPPFCRSICAVMLSGILGWVGCLGWRVIGGVPELTTITIRINGQGSVTPDYNGRLLKVGSFIQPRVWPAPGYVFAGWTGSSTCSSCTEFVVSPGLDLTANFVPNPFPAIYGEYNGLCFETNDVHPASSASFSLQLGAYGGLSGKFVLKGHTYSIGGNGYLEQVQADGSVQLRLYRGNPMDGNFRQVMTAELQFDLSKKTDVVTGTLSDAHWVLGGMSVWVPATWTATLYGERAWSANRTNAPPQVGSYTLLLPGPDASTGPTGTGFATITVDRSAYVRVAGFLADGSAIRQRTRVSTLGRWPLYVTARHGAAVCLGWIRFQDIPGSDMNGLLRWVQLPEANRLSYPAGFAHAVEAIGSRYIHPTAPKAPVLGYTNGWVTFSGGGLATVQTNPVTLTGNKVINEGTNKLSARLLPSTGYFQGTFTPSDSIEGFRFKGAMLQKSGAAQGHFLSANLGGKVTLTPRDEVEP